MIIDCISDLHGYYPKLEGGDILIIAGDLTARDEEHQYYEFNIWLCEQDYTCKIVIAGNHDNLLQEDSAKYLDDYPDFAYICDSGVEFEGLKIWGTPWTKTFKGMNPRCKAFTFDTEEELAEKWKLVPKDTNILITHSPQYGILDYRKLDDGSYYHMGSKSLEDFLFYNVNSGLDYHIFGHIHECGSQKEKTHSASDKYTSINASYVNERYKPVNKPIRIEL